MDKEKIGSGASMFSRTESMFNADPMQEIFELNLGDFMVEHLISEDLAKKISVNVHDKLNNLKNQLKECKVYVKCGVDVPNSPPVDQKSLK